MPKTHSLAIVIHLLFGVLTFAPGYDQFPAGATALQCLDDFYVVNSGKIFLSALSVVMRWFLEQKPRTAFPPLLPCVRAVWFDCHCGVCSLMTKLQYCTLVCENCFEGFLVVVMFFRTLT